MAPALEEKYIQDGLNKEIDTQTHSVEKSLIYEFKLIVVAIVAALE